MCRWCAELKLRFNCIYSLVLNFAGFIKAICQQYKMMNHPIFKTRLFIKKIDLFKFKEKIEKEEKLLTSINKKKTETKKFQTK